MVYIRIKKIEQKPYAYLVESKKSKKGPRQKVKKYLGRVSEFERKETGIKDSESKNYENRVISAKKKSKFLSSLVLPELIARGFKEKQEKNSVNKKTNIKQKTNLKLNYQLKNLTFDPKKLTLTKQTKSKTTKDAIISLNDGYLCSFTLQRILKFKKKGDLREDAEILAKYFLEAGIKISRENFVGYYKLL